MIRDLAAAFGALAAVTVLAALLGAANLGTALTFGAIAFMATIVGLIVIRGPEHGPLESDAPAEPEQRKRPKPSGRPRA
jgi:hypothetical protein